MEDPMNTGFMDYRMDIDDQGIASSQSSSQPTCPYEYRPPVDAPTGPRTFQPSWSYNHPSGSSTTQYFNPVSNPPRAYWGSLSPHPSQPLTPLPNGHNNLLAHPGRPGNTARYDHNPVHQTSDFGANNTHRFHPAPPLPDMHRFHSSNEGRQGENHHHTTGTAPSTNPTMPNYNPPDDSLQRRNDFIHNHMARSQLEAQQSNRHLRQPPTLTVQSTFFPTHLPQPNFTGNNRNSPFTPVARGSTYNHPGSMPIPSPSEPPRQDQQFEQTQRNAWARESNISSDYTEDSDEDSVDSLGGRPEHRDIGSQPYHPGARDHGQRRPTMSAFEGEERELAMERSRAARRAAIAAAKLVASPAAIASLEQVELSTLAKDDRNCIICYNEFGIMNPDGNIECAVRLPKCKHVFGDHCLKHWLKDSDSCPYCRDKLPSEPKKSHADEMRRLFGRASNASSQQNGVVSSDGRSAVMFTDNRHFGPAQAMMNQAHAEMQTQLHALYALEAQTRLRMENDALEQSEVDMRRHVQRQEEWLAMHPHAPLHTPRSIPDHDNRRRNRQRTNSIRSSTSSNNNQARFSNTAHRSNAAPLNLIVRTPNHNNRPSTETATANSPRSVTPHPGAVSPIPTPNFSGQVPRRSSLPSESSPLREAVLSESLRYPPSRRNVIDTTDTSAFSHSANIYETEFARTGVWTEDRQAWNGRPVSEGNAQLFPAVAGEAEMA